jgi:hypothetical protein
VRVTFGGHELFRIRPETGFWDEDVPRKIAESMPPRDLERLALLRGWLPVGDLPGEREEQPAVEVTDLVRLPDVQAWTRLIAETSAEFIAVLIGDERPHSSWLDEALVAFDGELVAAVLGEGIPNELPTQPLLLFRRTFRPTVRWENYPAYVVFRTSALRSIPDEMMAGGSDEPLAFALTLVTRLLACEWTVGWRDVHGVLAPAHVSPEVIGRAWALAELANDYERPARVARYAAGVLARAALDLRRRRTPARDVASEARGAISGVRTALTSEHRPASRAT